MASTSEAHRREAHDNLRVNYVALYRYGDVAQSEAIQQFQRLIQALAAVGLDTTVRPADDSCLLVFIKAKESELQKAVHRSRVKDWLFGICHAQPDANNKALGGTEADAERLRTVYNMIVLPKSEGGAGITPKHGEWTHVESIFPLHDKTSNRELIKNWSRKTFLTPSDLDQIRDRFGEKVGFYFAFLQSYFAFLIFPAVFGLSCWLLLGHFSIIFAVVNCLACVVFVEFWKRQEVDLSLRWQVKGVSAILTRRRNFKPEKHVVDQVTGETIGVFPAWKRLSRQLLQIPFAVTAVFALGTLIATCFAIEIFISEVYSGPFKSYLVFIPTVLLTLFVPTITAILTSVATWLAELENYETQDSHDIAMTQKIFVLNFITSYLPIFLTAFVYVPFGGLIVPYLDVSHLIARPFMSRKNEAEAPPPAFHINPSRLRKQVIYFTVTAQILSLVLETIVPYVKRRLFRKYKEFSQERTKGDLYKNTKASALFEDVPAEAEFLTRVRNEAELSEYDVTTDLREMCLQFGYLSLFSPVWPLVPMSFLINNWVELRSDFVKICVEHRRPVPERADTIGPWIDALGFLTWLGSITSAALVYLFRNDGLGPDGTPSEIKGWALLLTISFSEHLYLLVRLAVRFAVSQIDTAATRQERAELYSVRKTYLDATMNSDSTREADKLEQKSTAVDIHDETEVDFFWARQGGYDKSVQYGTGIIQAQSHTEPAEKKQQ